MTYFKKPDHEYHRVIFEFTDKEMENAGFVRLSLIPSELEILQLLQRIAKDDKKQLDVLWTFSMTVPLEDLQRKKDGWKAKALRLIGFLNNKDKEKEWLLNECVRQYIRGVYKPNKDDAKEWMIAKMQQALKEK